MPNFTVLDILLATEDGVFISPAGAKISKRFSLLTAEHVKLSKKDLVTVQTLIHYTSERYGVHLAILGGGSGCTEFHFELQGTIESTVGFVQRLMNDQTFLEKANAARFKVIIVEASQTVFLIGPNMSDFKPSNINIHLQNSTVSNLQVSSPRAVATDSKNHSEADLARLRLFLDELSEAVRTLDSNLKVPHSELVQDVTTLKAEFGKKTPRPGIITELLTNLGSVATLASFVDQIYPFIPKA